MPKSMIPGNPKPLTCSLAEGRGKVELLYLQDDNYEVTAVLPGGPMAHGALMHFVRFSRSQPDGINAENISSIASRDPQKAWKIRFSHHELRRGYSTPVEAFTDLVFHLDQLACVIAQDNDPALEIKSNPHIAKLLASRFRSHPDSSLAKLATEMHQSGWKR